MQNERHSARRRRPGIRAFHAARGGPQLARAAPACRRPRGQKACRLARFHAGWGGCGSKGCCGQFEGLWEKEGCFRVPRTIQPQPAGRPASLHGRARHAQRRNLRPPTGVRRLQRPGLRVPVPAAAAARQRRTRRSSATGASTRRRPHSLQCVADAGSLIVVLVIYRFFKLRFQVGKGHGLVPKRGTHSDKPRHPLPPCTGCRSPCRDPRWM